MVVFGISLVEVAQFRWDSTDRWLPKVEHGIVAPVIGNVICIRIGDQLRDIRWCSVDGWIAATLRTIVWRQMVLAVPR